MKTLSALRLLAILVLAFGIAGSIMLFASAHASAHLHFESQKKIVKAKKAIPDQYIVVLNDDAGTPTKVAQDLTLIYGGVTKHIYKHATKGFSISIPEAVAMAMSQDPRVKYIEEDSEVSIETDQSSATWGLDRIDQRELPLNSNYTYNASGAGVNVYVIDTGIKVTHQQFGGRASIGYDAVGDGQNGNDCNGHGTHVAGTVGGATYGVAKSAKLVAVRVLNCQGSGTISGVVAGVDWVTSNRVKPAVANMSLGGSTSTTLDTAIQNSIAAGIIYVVAAGNSTANACNYSPARVPEALTIGATDSSDQEASFSNYGSCVDLLAPGVSITSAWYTSDIATNTISGTSMATPHVTGAAALYLETNPTALPSTVEAEIESNATPNKIGAMKSSATPNLLLYTTSFGLPPSAPTAPSNLLATAASSSQINLTWTDTASNEYGFKIEQSIDGVTFTQIAAVGANTTTFSATNLSPSTTYYYRVFAYNGVGPSDYSNPASATTPALPVPPNAPTSLTATAVSRSQINLSWTDTSTNEDGFKIELSTNGTNFTQIATVGANATRYSSTGLARSTTYYYRVRAYSGGGNSAYSNTASARTPHK